MYKDRTAGIVILSFWAAWAEMRRKRLRTCLGITALAIGTISVVLSVGIVAGIVRAASDYIQVTGGLELIRIYDKALVQESNGLQFWRPLSLEDANQLALALGDRARLAPEVGFPLQPLLRPGKEPCSSFVVGCTKDYFPVNRSEIDLGRGIVDADILTHNRVIVLSPEARTALFESNQEALGQKLEIMGVQFEVVGVFKEYDYYTGPVKQGARFKNRFSVIPLSVAQDLGFGGSTQVTGIHVSVADFSDLAHLRARIQSVLLAGRAGLRDIEVETREREAEGWISTARSAKLAAFLLAGVALSIAGISITSLMLTSLAERVKEIGIRRACGASANDVVLQFLVESTCMGAIGGIVGLVLGYFLVPIVGGLIPATLPGKPIFVPLVALLGAGFSLSVGVLAGILPAMRAGRMHPLEAVRSS